MRRMVLAAVLAVAMLAMLVPPAMAPDPEGDDHRSVRPGDVRRQELLGKQLLPRQ